MKNFTERELSLINPFGAISAELVAAKRWQQLGKTAHEHAVIVVQEYLTGTSDSFRRSGIVHNWNDYVEASQNGIVRLPTNPSWRSNRT